MIITDKYNYFHIPKTGGTKLRELFIKYSIKSNNLLVWQGTGIGEMHTQKVPTEYFDKRQTVMGFRKLPDLILSHNVFFLRWTLEKGYDEDLWALIKGESIKGNIYDFNNKDSLIKDRFRSVDTAYKTLLEMKDVSYIRQEYLLEDAYSFIKSICLDCDEDILKESKRVNGNNFPQPMLTNKDIKNMYKNNPLWTKKEKELYES